MPVVKDSEPNKRAEHNQEEQYAASIFSRPFVFLSAICSLWQDTVEYDEDSDAYLRLRPIVPAEYLEPCRHILRHCNDTKPVSYVYSLNEKDFEKYNRLKQWIESYKAHPDTPVSTVELLEQISY